MAKATTPDEFLRFTADIPEDITDEPLAPYAIPGLPPSMDPMKPWLSVNVDAYVPVAKWILKQPFKFAAEKYDPLWELDEMELESLSPALTEATQKCLYDLNLSRFAGNPYVALAVGLGSLSLAKWGAIQLMQMMQQQQARAEADQRSSNRSNRIMPFQPQQRHPSDTQPVSSTTSIKTPGSGAGSSSADFRAAASRSSSSIESEPDDE